MIFCQGARTLPLLRGCCVALDPQVLARTDVHPKHPRWKWRRFEWPTLGSGIKFAHGMVWKVHQLRMSLNHLFEFGLESSCLRMTPPAMPRCRGFDAFYGQHVFGGNLNVLVLTIAYSTLIEELSKLGSTPPMHLPLR